MPIYVSMIGEETLTLCVETHVDTGQYLSWEHVGRSGDEVHLDCQSPKQRYWWQEKRIATHVWQLGTIESVQPQLVVSSSVVDNNSPIGVNRPLIKVGNNVCDCCTWVLDLYSTVGWERIGRNGSIVVETVCTMLPPNDSLDTRWVGCV